MAGVLTRWDPISDLSDLRLRLDRMFDDLADGRERHWTPAIDAQRSDGTLTIRADLPGIPVDEVKIEVADDTLTISGEHAEEHEERDAHTIRRERRHGAFSRSITLPPGVDADAITATSSDGVLEVCVPLPAGSTKGRLVEIVPKAAGEK